MNSIPEDGADVLISNAAVADLHLDRTRTVSRIVFPSTGTRKVVLGDYNLTITNTTTGYTNAFIQTNGEGRLFANIANGSSFTFPVGTETFTPVSISNNAGATDLFSVGLVDGVKSNGLTGTEYNEGGYVKRTWDIHKQNPNAGNGISMQFSWNNGDVIGLFTTPVLFHYGDSWERLKGTFNFGNNKLTYNNYTGTFSPFAILDETTTLPVLWGNIIAQKEQGAALIKWSTLTEVQTGSFKVQHSVDGREWKDISGVIAAAGNSNIARNYQYLHESPVSGSNYYRIQQQDIDGRKSYSKVVSVMMPAKDIRFSIYPNPSVNGQVKVTTSAAGTLNVYNNIGVLVKQQKLQAGINNVDLSKLPKAVYRLHLNGESTSVVIN